MSTHLSWERRKPAWRKERNQAGLTFVLFFVVADVTVTYVSGVSLRISDFVDHVFRGLYCHVKTEEKSERNELAKNV